MAEKLATMPKRKRGHDWDSWSDGSVWKIRKGVDFKSDVESMRTQLYGKARAIGKRVEIAEVDRDEGTITFRMLEKTES